MRPESQLTHGCQNRAGRFTGADPTARGPMVLPVKHRQLDLSKGERKMLSGIVEAAELSNLGRMSVRMLVGEESPG